MPRIEDFKIKLKEFKPVKYTPWDNSPDNQQTSSSGATPLESLVTPKETHQTKVSDTPFEPVQKGFKRGSIVSQTMLESGSNLKSNPIQTGFESSAKTGFEPNSNLESIEEEMAPKPVEELSLLTGTQKKILIYLIDDCFKEKGLNLININTTELSKLLCIPKDTIKTSLRRLQEKNLIKKKLYKQGVGGFLRFEISEEVKSTCLELQKNDLLNRFKNGSEIGSKTGFLSNVVSSSINTTTYLPETRLPNEWELVDCSSLEHIGFSKSHLIQIYRELARKPELMLSAEMIQESIDALAFDLKYNSVASTFKNSPSVVLTAVLKKGTPYVSKTPEKVLTPREEAMQQYLLSQEKKHLMLEEIEVKSKELAQQEWLSNLSEEELLSEFSHDYEACPSGMPEKIYQTSKRKKAIASAKEYFDTVVWPEKRKQILNEGG